MTRWARKKWYKNDFFIFPLLGCYFIAEMGLEMSPNGRK